MDNLAISVYARIRQIYDSNFPFPENGYVGDYINEIAIQIKQEYDHYKKGLQCSSKPGSEKKESDFVFNNNKKIQDFFAGLEEGKKDIVSITADNILNIDNDVLQYLKLRAEEHNFLSITGTLKRLGVKHDVLF